MCSCPSLKPFVAPHYMWDRLYLPELPEPSIIWVKSNILMSSSIAPCWNGILAKRSDYWCLRRSCPLLTSQHSYALLPVFNFLLSSSRFLVPWSCWYVFFNFYFVLSSHLHTTVLCGLFFFLITCILSFLLWPYTFSLFFFPHVDRINICYGLIDLLILHGLGIYLLGTGGWGRVSGGWSHV